MLQERLLCYAARGKPAKAAALAAGPLLCVACRAEAFPLRGRPGAPGVTLPSPPAWNAADSAAQLWAQTAPPSAAAAARCCLLRVGLAAAAFGWRGWAPADRDAHPREVPIRALLLSDEWKKGAGQTQTPAPAGSGGASSPGGASSASSASDPASAAGAAVLRGGDEGWLPPAALASVLARAEAVLAEADDWAPAFTASAPPACAAAEDAVQGAAQGLAMALLPLANMLMQCGPAQQAGAAARAARAGARLCGIAGNVANQGEALHLLGAALFHCGPAQWGVSRAAFEAAAAAKTAAGAAQEAPARDAAAQQQACGMVETLLFLAKLQWETRQGGEAERSHGRAVAVGRARLGDGHPIAKKAMLAAIEFKAKQQQLGAAMQRAAGGGASP